MFVLNVVRIILISGLVFLIIVWKFTSDYSLYTWLKNIPSIRGLTTILYELLVFLQVFGLIKPPQLPIPSLPLVDIGLIIFIIGVFLAAWAKFTMKENWGVPARHNFLIQRELVTTGPFAYTRNPIYLGLILAFSGVEMALRSVLLILIIPLFILIFLAVSREELLLEKHFGGKYLSYKKKTPRFIYH